MFSTNNNKKKSALKLFNFWKAHRGKKFSLPEPFFQCFLNLNKASVEALKAGEFDQLINNMLSFAIAQDNIIALQMIAYAIFSGRITTFPEESFVHFRNHLNTTLDDERANNHNHTYTSAWLEKLKDEFLAAFTEWKQTYPYPNPMDEKYFPHYFLMGLNEKDRADFLQNHPQPDLLKVPIEKYMTWFDELKAYVRLKNGLLKNGQIQIQSALDQENNYADGSENSEEVIHISHGGGFYHIIDFLLGRSVGYNLENNQGLGLQVSTNFNGRDKFYANTKPPLHFDTPAILKADIQAQYLQKASATAAGYEAELRPESIKHLKNLEIEELGDSNSFRKR